jgi:endo-1,4-beta-xylanase
MIASMKILISLFVLVFLSLLLFFTLPLPNYIPVLMYHYVGTKDQAAEQGNYVSRETFEKQMAFLRKAGYRVISLDDYYAIRNGQKKGSGRQVAITFDDGEASFASEAVPVLRKYEYPVTMFLISGSLATGANGSMNLETVKKLQTDYPWISFQGHSKIHWHFKEETQAQLKEEIFVSKRELEDYLNKPVVYFAYPFGEIETRSHQMVQDAGYRLAFTTGAKKLGNIPEGPYALTRVKVDEGASNLFIFWSYISGIYPAYKSFYHKLKTSFSAQ